MRLELLDEFLESARVLALELHPGRPFAVLRAGRRHALGIERLRRSLAFGAELVLLARLGAVAAARDNERPRAVRMREADVQGREPAHGEPDHVRLVDLQVIEDCDDVVARSGLRVFLDVVGNVRRRIAAGVVRDAAVAPREVPQLRLPAPVVAGELVHEDHRVAAAGLLVVELHTVARGRVGHAVLRSGEREG